MTTLTDSGDRRRLAESTQRLGGFLDPEAFAQQAAREVDRLLRVPLASVAVHEGDTLGVLYGATRTVGSLGDRAMTLLQAIAVDLAPLMSLTMRADRALSERVHAERLRIASDLHDDVGRLLFSIGVAAAQMARSTADGPVAQSALNIEAQARLAARRMREAFDALAPAEGHETVPCEPAAA